MYTIFPLSNDYKFGQGLTPGLFQSFQRMFCVEVSSRRSISDRSLPKELHFKGNCAAGVFLS
jgi:hypothetical protein